MTDQRTARSGEKDENSVLELRKVTKLYPGTVALHDASLVVRAGQIHGVIGKNGAGKTTLMAIISGIIPPSQGDIILRGKQYKSLSRTRSKKEGISIVTQEPQVIPDFSVAENLFAPDYICSLGGRLDWRAIHDQAEQILLSARISINPRSRMADLGVSEQQLVLVLKACYVENSRIIILDEVTASLSRKDQSLLYRIVKEQKEAGKAILFISHRMREILEICDRVSVLRDGETITTQPCQGLDEQQLSSFIVGKDFRYEIEVSDQQEDRKAQTAREPILIVENLTSPGVFTRISFELHEGEILGLAGLRGSGRTEILKAIAGIEPAGEGHIAIGKTTMRWRSPSQAKQNGVVYLPEDRDREGLVEILTVKHNLTLSSLKDLTKKALINRREEERVVNDLIELFSIATPSSEQETRYLSGGNRQKVVVGRILATQPQVFLLDEPTKGIDILTKKNLLEIIRDKLTRSSGVILSSPGLEDLMMVSDRILVLNEGTMVREFRREEFAETDIYLAMQGVNRANAQQRGSV